MKGWTFAPGLMASCSTRGSPGWPSDWLGEPSPAPWTSCHGGTWTKSARRLHDTSATSAHKRQALSQGRHAFAHAQSRHVITQVSDQKSGNTVSLCCHHHARTFLLTRLNVE